MAMNSPERETYLDTLARIADPHANAEGQMEALAELVSSLPVAHPYRLIPLEQLYERILPDWAMRLYVVNGRAVLRPVSRPPQMLADILL
jgi:hypothetical protein